MPIPHKTLRNGFFLPDLSLGTWMIGGATDRDPHCDSAAAVASIRRALDSGVSCIDTAEMYAAGYSEELVGLAIDGRDRDSLQIASKVWPDNLRHDDVLKACELSLERLGINHLDVYLVHAPNPDVPISETMQAMRELVDREMIKAVGVSNFSVASLRRAQDAFDGPIVQNQVHYNLIFREPENGLLQYCQENDILLAAWRPLEKGILAQNGSPLMAEMCEKYGRTAAQVSINWLVSQQNVVTLSTMRSPQNLADNLGAVGWTMEAADIESLRRNFPNRSSVSNRAPLA
jgi:diketogulonate reductase-like aldo/keto reductase